jgi:hypothetical protein
MMTGRDVGGDVPSEMTAICAFLPFLGPNGNACFGSN